MATIIEPGNERRLHRVRTGIALLAAAALLWSINGWFIKVLYHTHGVGGLTIAAYRSGIAAVALLPLAIHRWRPVANPAWLGATTIVFTFMCATFVVATTRTSAANAIILQYTAPAWVFLISPWVLGERSTRVQWMSMLLAMAGVAIIFFAQISSDTVGLSIGLASGVVFGVQSVLFRKIRDVDPVVVACATCGVSAVLLMIAAAATGGVAVSRAALVWLVLMGVVQFALPYVLYAAGVARVTAQEAVLIVLIEPVLNPVWVALLRHETPAPTTILGGGMILASVLFLAWVETRKRPGSMTVAVDS